MSCGDRGRAATPRYPITPVLVALGFEDVPYVEHGYRKVKCHFHGDRNPSASVSKYGYVCFSCGRSGDALKLLMEEEGCSFADAKRRAEALTGGGNHGGREQPAGWAGRNLLD